MISRTNKNRTLMEHNPYILSNNEQHLPLTIKRVITIRVEVSLIIYYLNSRKILPTIPFTFFDLNVKKVLIIKILLSQMLF